MKIEFKLRGKGCDLSFEATSSTNARKKISRKLNQIGAYTPYQYLVKQILVDGEEVFATDDLGAIVFRTYPYIV